MSARRSAVIVFGGAGFIGTHLLERLAHTGRYGRVISYDIRAAKAPVAGVEYVTGDVREPISLDGDLSGAEIYNLAAIHTTPGHEDWEYFWTNVLGASHVCDFASRIGTTFLLFTASISVYGPSEEPVDEGTPPAPVSAYGRSKFQAEGIHRSWVENGSDRQLVIVRPAVIFGPGEGGNFTKLASLLARKRFVYPGRRETIKSCGYVEELVDSMEFARDLNRRTFTYNFSYPERTTSEHICNAFVRAAGFAAPRWVVPLPLMLAAAFGFEILGKLGLRTSINRERVLKLARSTNVLPTALVEAGYRYRTDVESALRDWGQKTGGTYR
ncbi:NAD-dependent epimerase/dehydratase family protein [Starkeya koreensis]|uniref:NAD-dependent epimerase/dehydratase family protein n=1 Tax=Ancylobacter koreensis TaxID=266121 RepID=A0ABT0DGT5_9HYPH|nr:NAD-dependent epimerase/dehydratase family protein [Ancylobacter koreensis]MCK0206419.1 NAD-dependent epimerase/dehydratase family protein [Ancylobacter koreensis]